MRLYLSEYISVLYIERRNHAVDTTLGKMHFLKGTKLI